MDVVRWDGGGREVEHFESRAFTHLRLAVVRGGAAISALRLGAGGRIGYHEAAGPQLLLVVAGSGRVRGEDGAWHDVEAGSAVVWASGEGHETVSETGLEAVVVEAELLELER